MKVRYFIFGILLIGWLSRPSECFGDQEVQKNSKEQSVLEQEEIDLIQNLVLLENLDYLEEEDVDFLSNYDEIKEDADDTKNDN